MVERAPGYKKGNANAQVIKYAWSFLTIDQRVKFFACYLIQFDTKSQFEEWRSTQAYEATDMIVGNVDKDPEIEIIMNTGEILSSKFKNVKWKSDIELGDRLYLIDIDDDGILELVNEYDQSYVRIIDVDERREKW